MKSEVITAEEEGVYWQHAVLEAFHILYLVECCVSMCVRAHVCVCVVGFFTVVDK